MGNYQIPAEAQAGPKRRGVALILMAISFLFVGGMLGLAIDGGIAYLLKARLSQSIDAAALAGARSLSRGADLGSQSASATATADKFFAANFPNHFWGCSVPVPTVGVTEDNTLKIRKVTVSATITSPLYFLRMLGLNTVNLTASGQASRRDANIMIVLDRSGSMSAAISQLTASADWFVGNFAPGRDKVGLVTFGGTYNLIKPTTSFSPTVVNSINTLTSSTVYGTTNHSQPLWVAYQALAEANEPGALNAIVFFTDGEPNTITADWVTPYNNLKNPTTCNNGKVGATYSPVIGWALAIDNSTYWGLFSTGGNPPYQPNSTSAGTVPTAYITTASDKAGVGSQKGDSTNAELRSMSTNSGCNFLPSSPTNVASDFKQIPAADYYGNSTKPASPYKPVTLTSFNAPNLIAAAFNAGDQAAARMRTGPLNGIVPLVDCIALTTTATIDSTYMKRLANTVDSGIYDNTKPTGVYVYAATTADLQGAFVQIASQILHLSL